MRGRARDGDDEDDDSDDLPAPVCTIESCRHQWETPALATEVRSILDSIDTPPADPAVMFQFQKVLYRTKYFDYDARGQIILTCRCILESEGNEGAFTEPYVSAVYSACNSREFADCGLELMAAFDEIRLVDIMQTMKSLEFFLQKDVVCDLSTIIRNKLRRILAPAPQPEPPPKPSKHERIAAEKQVRATATARIVEQNIELGRKLVALREVTASNRIFGHAVRQQFRIDDPNSVTEMMRVAKLYGARPEIFRSPSWHALTELRRRQRQRRSVGSSRPESLLANVSPAPR